MGRYHTYDAEYEKNLEKAVADPDFEGPFILNKVPLELLVNHRDDQHRMVIVLGSGQQKYLVAEPKEPEQGRPDTYIISLAGVIYHEFMFNCLENGLFMAEGWDAPQVKAVGGGLIKREGDEFILWGDSVDYGKAYHEKIAGLLRKIGIRAKVSDDE